MDRHKDSDPKQTVARIKGILGELDLHPEGELMEFAGRFYSLRIQDPATGTGTNGKGASPDLALASAYGEYMERLQNDLLLPRKSKTSEYFDGSGFRRWPDEHLVSFDEGVAAQPFILEEMRRGYVPDGVLGSPACEDVPESEIRAFWKSRIGESVAMVPYYCVGTRTCVNLADDIICKMGMSNGLSSGNTPEEALVEGMSELCERYARAAIMDGELCPPRIARAFIERHCPEQAAMLRTIEQHSPELNIIVLDASLGRGVPAVSMLFIDRERGAIRPKFGAHPSFAIALERCMTEQYQGYLHEGEDMLSPLFTEWDEWSRKAVNFHALRCSAFAVDRFSVPTRMVLRNPDWEFEPWGLDDDFTNRQGLRQLSTLLRRIGGEVYIRDNGYLGFPAYRVFVPGVSHPPVPSGKGALWAEEFGVASACAMTAFEQGDYRLAADFLKMNGTRRDRCAAQELLCRAEGIPEQERNALLGEYFGAGTAAYAKAVWRSDDVEGALRAFRRRLESLERLTRKPDAARAAQGRACAALARKLAERKRAAAIDQMGLAALFDETL